MLTIMIALGVLAACTAARWSLDRPARRESEHAGGLVRLTKLWNKGASFGLPIPQRAVMALSCLGLGFLWTQRRRSPLGTGLVLGGGLNNFLERLRAGKVFDYIKFPKAPGALRRYVYNLADLAILLGGIVLLLGKRRK